MGDGIAPEAAFSTDLQIGTQARERSLPMICSSCGLAGPKRHSESNYSAIDWSRVCKCVCGVRLFSIVPFVACRTSRFKSHITHTLTRVFSSFFFLVYVHVTGVYAEHKAATRRDSRPFHNSSTHTQHKHGMLKGTLIFCVCVCVCGLPFDSRKALKLSGVFNDSHRMCVTVCVCV